MVPSLGSTGTVIETHLDRSEKATVGNSTVQYGRKKSKLKPFGEQNLLRSFFGWLADKS